ncbi:MAG: nucleotide exchange factor GrpE [Desulfobulbus propionicus]|nr:MAG: nucleotide exchange factor GrpE [Desulfobulbus propionicus]
MQKRGIEVVEEQKQQRPVEQEEETVIPENVDEVHAAVEEAEEKTVENLQRELDETKDSLLRVAAEFENFKKRMEREQAKLIKYAGENMLREMLTTLDNLDRAVEQGKAEVGEDGVKLQAMLEGLDLTQKGLVATLEKFGVKALESVGQPFNPDEQDALTMEAHETIPANHVVKEYAKGYRFKDRVLRHAQVVVSSGPAE